MSVEIHFQTAEGQHSPPTWMTRLVLPKALTKKKNRGKQSQLGEHV